MPGRMRSESGAVLTSPPITPKMLVWLPSSTVPSRMRMASNAPDSFASWFAIQFAISDIDLMSHLDHRRSGRVIAEMPTARVAHRRKWGRICIDRRANGNLRERMRSGCRYLVSPAGKPLLFPNRQTRCVPANR